MKLTQVICKMVLLSTIAWTSNANAENNAPQGQFAGGGYRVETGNGGDYVGYDCQGRKLVILGNHLSTHGKTATWNNNGYTYQLTGIGNSLVGNRQTQSPEDGENSTVYRKARLTIVNPQGRVILNQVMTRVD